MEGGCVMVPPKQDSLDQDCEGAGERGNVARYPPSPADQNQRRAALRILIICRPASIRRIRGELI
jgi:hypothetical protein